MKKAFTLLTVLLFTVVMWAQSPNKMSYQAMVRLHSGLLITNQTIGIRISILKGAENGSPVYVETQAPKTNENGLMSLEIGNGFIISGEYTSIEWSNDSYYLKTEISPSNDGINYEIIDVTQLLAVPYALHAKSAENLTGTLNEADPVFNASVAKKISGNDVEMWNSNSSDIAKNTNSILAKSEEIALKENATNKSTDGTLGSNSDVFFPTQKAVKTYIDSKSSSDSLFINHPAYGISENKFSNWDSAYGWGNHANNNYLSSFTETDPTFSIHPSFEITKDDIDSWKANYIWFTTNADGYLKIASPAGGITAADTTKWNNNSGSRSGIATPDASPTIKGKVQLAGDLAGTAAAPLIGAGKVTYAKIQNVSATDKLLGRSTAGAGIVEEIPLTAAGRALIAGADAAAQKTTLALNNVDNTSDALKPVSDDTQDSLDLKANLVSPTFTGTPTLPTGAIATTQTSGNNTTRIATTEFVTSAITAGGSSDATTTVKGVVQLAGDLDGTADAPRIGSVGNSSATQVSTATVLANNATNANTASQIVKRDASGDFSAGTITADLTGDISGTAANVTGTVVIKNGGTGAITKAAAFDSLSPLTQQGDIMIGGTKGTGTRLAKGRATQILSMNSGATAPEWVDLKGGVKISADDSEVLVSDAGSPGSIYFKLDGSNKWKMIGSRFEPGIPGAAVYIGKGAGAADATGMANSTYIGNNAGNLNTINGVSNTAVGNSAFTKNTLGEGNVAMGHAALNKSISDHNAAFGFASLPNLAGATDHNNTALGYSALFNSNGAVGNTAIGFEAGKFNSSGDNNVYIGYQAGPSSSSTASNQLYIANSSGTPTIFADLDGKAVAIKTTNLHSKIFYVNGAAGGTSTWAVISDKRLKQNITTIENPMEKILALRGVNFNWKDTTDKTAGLQMGFIAQEAEQVIPEVVSRPANDRSSYTMEYAPITALLVEAIKEQQKNFEQQAISLQNKVKELDEAKQRIASLEARFAQLEELAKRIATADEKSKRLVSAIKE